MISHAGMEWCSDAIRLSLLRTGVIRRSPRRPAGQRMHHDIKNEKKKKKRGTLGEFRAWRFDRGNKVKKKKRNKAEAVAMRRVSPTCLAFGLIVAK